MSSQQAAQAQESLDTRRAALQSQVEAATALVAATDGEVLDDAPRVMVTDEIGLAEALLAVTSDVTVPTLALVEDGAVRLEPDLEWDAGYTARATSLEESVSGLQATHSAWALTQLEAAITGAREVLAGTEGQVADNGVRERLSAAIAAAQAAWEAGDQSTPAGTILAEHDALTTARTDVESSRASWAYDALSAAIDTARPVLDTSAGQVADNAVRDQLFLALTAGQGVLDAGIGATGTNETLTARDSVNAATSNVQTAVAQFQATPQG